MKRVCLKTYLPSLYIFLLLYKLIYYITTLHVFLVCHVLWCKNYMYSHLRVRASVGYCVRAQNACANKSQPHLTAAQNVDTEDKIVMAGSLATRCCVLLLMAWLLVSVNGQCQSALQAVTNLTNSQTAATVVYRSLNGEQLLVRRDHDRYGCVIIKIASISEHAAFTLAQHYRSCSMSSHCGWITRNKYTSMSSNTTNYVSGFVLSSMVLLLLLSIYYFNLIAHWLLYGWWSALDVTKIWWWFPKLL